MYAAGLVQGIALVTFPAAGTVFTSPDGYDLSSTRYGLMFLPQVLTAVLASLLGGGLARRVGTRTVYLAGLVADLVSMTLLVLSQVVLDHHGPAYALLLLATAFLGVGFGLVVPTLNTLTAVFHPDQVDRSVLVLNALLGLGTTLAPVFVAIFVGLGFWWGLPVLAVVLSPCCSWSASPCRCTRAPGPLPAPAPASGRRYRPASGCSPPSHCSTACARP